MRSLQKYHNIKKPYLNCHRFFPQTQLSYETERFSLSHGSTLLVGLGLLCEVLRSHSRHTILGRTPPDE
jgi:hypothetical protein